MQLLEICPWGIFHWGFSLIQYLLFIIIIIIFVREQTKSLTWNLHWNLFQNAMNAEYHNDSDVN